MADAVGEFNLKHINSAYAKDDAGVVVCYVNYEGEATGFGTVFGTMSFPLPDGGASSGTCAWTGQAFPPDGSWVSGSGEGTWEQVEGRYAWKVTIPQVENSDGSKNRSEGEIDLAARTFNGKLFEV